MYRSRPRGSLDADAQRYLSSIGDDASILYYDILGSQVHSIMLHEIGILKSNELKKILQALEDAKEPGMLISSLTSTDREITTGTDKAPVNKIDSFEDIHELLESFVIERAGMESGGKMHTARSRNDQVMLDVRMKSRDDINLICDAIITLIDSMLRKATENTTTLMPMYTHLQQAQLGTFSHYLLSYVDALFRDMERLYVTYGRINQSPLGACAIGGTSINIDRRRTAIMLGFDDLVKNSIDATSSRDSIVELVSDVSILMITLSRIAEDFVIWSSSEFGYIELSDQFSSSSSAMPQKKNPDPLELLRAKSAGILGNLVSIQGTLKALPSGYSRDLQEIKPLIWKSTSTALYSLRILNGIINTMNVRKDRMYDAAANSYAISIDIAEQLVLRHGLAFRSAHRLVGLLVERAVSTNNLPLSKLDKNVVRTVLENVQVKLDVDALVDLISEMTPERSLELRVSEGSPTLDQQQSMIKLCNTKAAGYRSGVLKRKSFVKGAFESLSGTVRNYLDKY